MNELLPKKEKIKPITNTNSTFYGCGFEVDFDALPFIKKVQIINDIVRQSMLPVINSNPDDDTLTMMGNCHTAALISISYLESLKIGKNYRYVLGVHRPFEPEDVNSKHALVLLDDEKGNTYEYDATPFVGYGYGEVRKLDNHPLYDSYIPIKGQMLELITKVRYFMYERKMGMLTPQKVAEYEYIFELCAINPYLKGFASYGYKLLYDSPFKNDAYIKRAMQIDPYSVYDDTSAQIKNRKELFLKQKALWEEELYSLSDTKSSDVQRKQMLASYIIHETKRFAPTLERYLDFNDKKIPLSFLTPRFFYENGLNCIIIKASAYRSGLRATIRESFLKKGNGQIGEYFTNISSPSDLGLKPVLYSHTLGDIYERSMNGPADIFLVEAPADILYAKKKELRSSLNQNITGKEVMWSDGQKILWHPFVTNLVHTTDGPVESSLHYNIGFPEHQVMTRFMYPNPVLERKIKR